MTLLSTFALEGNSDKGPNGHDYTDRYDALFHPFRLQPVTLLEIGVLGGDSIDMWAKFFPNLDTRIHGLDIHDWGYHPADPRIYLHYGDGSNREVLDRIPGPFTVVIEDGSHMASHQIDSFRYLWSRMEPGGIYCCEDLHTCHSWQHRDCHQTMIQFLAQVAAEMQDPRGADGQGRYNPEHPWSDIESIAISKGLAVIRKRL